MTLKERIEVVQSIVTISAVVIGGLWTYRLFIQERKQYPHANIEHKTSDVSLPDETHLLRAEVQLTNTGNGRLLLGNWVVRVQQILPLPYCHKVDPCAIEEVNQALTNTERGSNRFTWPLLAERENKGQESLDIEPGESDSIEFEFAIPPTVKVVRVYSYFQNRIRSTEQEQIGWSRSSVYEFAKSKEARIQ